MKAYGRAPTFLLATGYEQAWSVAAYLAGDLEAAARVELDLPETGVCNGPGRRRAEGSILLRPCRIGHSRQSIRPRDASMAYGMYTV